MVIIANYADDIARRVSQTMEAAGISVARLSELTGIPASTMASRLSGAREFTFRELSLIANALDVSPSSLTPSDFAAKAVA